MDTTNANGDSCDIYFNILENPQLVNPIFSDLHLQSTTGSYHNGQWLPDPNHSPCIDAGDPSLSFANEPEPNGGIINIGAYGNTDRASLSAENSNAPESFDLASPAEGDTCWTLDTLLVWYGTTDPGLDDTPHYDVWMDTLADLSTAWQAADSIADTTLGLNDLSDDQIYYWTVRATDNNTPGTWANDTLMFRTYLPEAPGAFTLSAPDSGSIVHSSMVEVSWAPSTDPDPGDTVLYQVDWSLNSNLATYDSALTGLTAYTITDVSGSLDELPDGSTIYWRVKAVDGFDLYTWGSDSAVWSFTTNLTSSLDKYFVEGWHLFSIPLVPNYSHIDSILGDDISGTYFVFNYISANGYFLLDSVEHGQGYWLALEDGSTIDIDGEEAADSTAIDLCEGWNMVGAAQSSDYPRDSLNFTDGNTILTFSQAVDSSWIAVSLYRFDNGTGSYVLEDTLEPWSGYWLNALEDNLQMITYPLQSGDGEFLAVKDESREAVEDEDNDNWSVPIILRQVDIIADVSSFGMNSNAADGYDLWFDFAVPPIPPSGDYVRAVFEHPEWNAPVGDLFCTDVRSLPENESQYTWKFRIEASSPGMVTVNFENIAEHLPAGYAATAAHGDWSIDLLKKHAFTFEYTSPYEVKVVVSNYYIAGDYIEGISDLPSEHTVAGIYPNPFNSTTTLQIELPQRSKVKIELYNINGQFIRTIYSGIQNAGSPKFRFDASDLASGVYFYKFRAESLESSKKFSEVNKLILLK